MPDPFAQYASPAAPTAGKPDPFAAYTAPSAPDDSSSGVIPYALTGAAGAMRFGAQPLATAVMDFATSPAIPALGSKAGQVVGGIGPATTALLAGRPMEALTAAALAGRTSWMGGRAGWFTAKAAQKLAGPISEGLEAVAPYAEAASTPLAVISGGAALAAPFLDDPQFKALMAQHASAGRDALQKTGSYWDALKAYFSGQATLQSLSDNTK